MIQQFSSGYVMEIKSVLLKDICTTMFTAALFTIAKLCK